MCNSYVYRFHPHVMWGSLYFHSYPHSTHLWYLRILIKSPYHAWFIAFPSIFPPHTPNICRKTHNIPMSIVAYMVLSSISFTTPNNFAPKPQRISPSCIDNHNWCSCGLWIPMPCIKMHNRQTRHFHHNASFFYTHRACLWKNPHVIADCLQISPGPVRTRRTHFWKVSISIPSNTVYIFCRPVTCG